MGSVTDSHWPGSSSLPGVRGGGDGTGGASGGGGGTGRMCEGRVSRLGVPTWDGAGLMRQGEAWLRGVERIT